MARFLVLLALVFTPIPIGAQSTERLYQAACDGGDASSCNVFGLMYETGSDVPQDLPRAASLYERACGLGAFAGCANLGLLHEAGMGVARDVNRARMLHAVACQGGEPVGCERMAALTDVDIAPPTGTTFRRGRVRHAATGEPLGETLISVGDDGVAALSDSQGFFLIPALARGEYRLTADRVGYTVSEGLIQFPFEGDLLVLMTPDEIENPNAPGRIEGRVSAVQGDELQNVEVSVVGQPNARALTNGQGRFTLPGLAPGPHEVQFAMLGYAQRAVALVVHPGRTTEVDATLSTDVIELEPIQVVVRSGYLERNGFYARERSTFGRFFDRDDIEELNPSELSDLLRRVPGVRLGYTRDGSTFAQSRRSMQWGLDQSFNPAGQGVFTQGGTSRVNAVVNACPMAVYVDGVPTFDSDLDWIPVSWIDAVEVYTSGINAPMVFTFGGASCGAVAVWTQR